MTPPETDLFSTVIAPLQEAWDGQLARLASGGVRPKGLAGVVDDGQFTALVSGLVNGVIAAVHALDESAAVVVEKSPSHSQHVALIRKYIPDAAFVHVVRDGRDVVASLQSAARGWGSYWASESTRNGAQRWRENVRAARDATRGPHDTEVRYEHLRAGDPEPLQRAFATCGLTVDRSYCTALLERYSLGRMASGVTPGTIAFGGALRAGDGAHREPDGFFGPGRVGGWADTWAEQDRLRFDAVAGDLLLELGYEPDHEWAGSSRQRRWYARRAYAARYVGKSARRIGRTLTRSSERLLSRFPEGAGRQSSPSTDEAGGAVR